MSATTIALIGAAVAAVLAGLIMAAAGNLVADELRTRRQPDASGRPLRARDALSAHYLTLPWYFFRRGRCPHCQARRSLRAPLLEAAMITASCLIAWRLAGDPVRILLFWGYVLFLLTVLVIDVEQRISANATTHGSGIVAFVSSFLPHAPSPRVTLIGGLLAFPLFLLVATVTRGATGTGGVKLVGVVGIITGYARMIPALLVGIVIGALGATVFMALRRVARGSMMAYVPFLALGVLVVLLLLQK